MIGLILDLFEMLYGGGGLKEEVIGIFFVIGGPGCGILVTWGILEVSSWDADTLSSGSIMSIYAIFVWRSML